MFEKPISRDADKAICQIYKSFLEKRKNGETKETAKHFNEDFSKGNADDFYSAIQELKKASLLTVYIDGSFALKDEAIVYMENRFLKGADEVIEYIAKFL